MTGRTVKGVAGAAELADSLEVLFEDAEQAYLGEPVTVVHHMLQTAALAEEAGAPPAMRAAALLHDIGHLLGEEETVAVAPSSKETEADHGGDQDRGQQRRQATLDRERHEERGAAWLGRWLPPPVTEPVRLHVAAKRWLCTVDPAYRSRLSIASQQSLVRQGGAMDEEERRRFEDAAGHQEAAALRAWDDAAKDPSARTPPLAHYLTLVLSLAK